MSIITSRLVYSTRQLLFQTIQSLRYSTVLRLLLKLCDVQFCINGCVCLISRMHNSVSEAAEGSVHEFGAAQPVQGTSREQSFGMSALYLFEFFTFVYYLFLSEL